MLKDVRVADKVIGKGKPVFITAEIGQNHNGEIEIAKKLIDMAALANVDAVKFCKRNIDKELSKEAFNAPYIGPQSFGPTYGEHRRKLELSDENYHELADYCREKKLIFYASVCDEDSADLLEQCGAPLFKIASRDLVNLPLLEHVAKKGKPVILSTGMSSEKEVGEAVELVRKYNKDLVLMHCTSQYPCNYENIFLYQMKRLEEKYNCLVGFSEHSIGILMAVLGAALGAVAIEKHITLARCMKGTDQAGALEFPGLMRVVRDIRNMEKAMKGIGVRKILEAEMPARQKLGKSIAARRDIKKGETIKANMLCVRGPGKGPTPRYAPAYIGQKAVRDIEAKSLIQFEDIGLSQGKIDEKKLEKAVGKFDWLSLIDN